MNRSHALICVLPAMLRDPHLELDGVPHLGVPRLPVGTSDELREAVPRVVLPRVLIVHFRNGLGCTEGRPGPPVPLLPGVREGPMALQVYAS